MPKNPFQFYHDEATLAESLNGAFVVHVPSGLTSDRALFDALHEVIQFPYYGWNFDSLNDCLSDLSWIEEKKIYFVHVEVPRLTNRSRRIYCEILARRIAFWDKYDDHQFGVFFSSDCIDEVEAIVSDFSDN